jgi:hypothetical protein
MWLVRFLVSYVMLSVFGLTLGLFLAQNARVEQLAFFGLDLSTNFAWILLGAAACGFLVALLLVLPGRIGVTLHNWALVREAGHFETELALLQEQRARLLDQHEHMLAGHQRLLLNFQQLLADHSQVVAERDQARAQLMASAAARAVDRHTVPSVPSARPRPSAEVALPAAPPRSANVVREDPSTTPKPRALQHPALRSREQVETPSSRLRAQAPAALAESGRETSGKLTVVLASVARGTFPSAPNTNSPDLVHALSSVRGLWTRAIDELLVQLRRLVRYARLHGEGLPRP